VAVPPSKPLFAATVIHGANESTKYEQPEAEAVTSTE
jgi:hypothetical protein